MHAHTCAHALITHGHSHIQGGVHTYAYTHAQRKRESREGRRKADEKEKRNYQDVFSWSLAGKYFAQRKEERTERQLYTVAGGLVSQPGRPDLETNTSECCEQGNVR